MRKQALAGVIAAIAVIGLAATGCTGTTNTNPGTETDPDKGTDALKIGNFLDVSNWDPSLADIGFDGPYLSAVYDPLLAIDADGQPVAALADKWEVAEDGLTITMDLRTDAKFSDGETFDAEAAVKGLEYLKAGATSQEAYLSVKDFAAVDEDTIEIHLTKRDDTILYLMSLGRSYMASPKAIEAGTLSKEPVGSGPYTLDTAKSVSGSHYYFTKVADHWAADVFEFSTVEVLPIGDATAMENAMQSGQVNVIYADEANIPEAEAQGWNIAGEVATGVGLQYTDRAGAKLKPLGDTRVRQALASAFDGGAILESIGSGAGVHTNQVFAAERPGWLADLNDLNQYDPEKAKELLAEAGYPDGFEVHMPMAPPFQPWQAITEQSLGAIGVKVIWDNMQMGDYMATSATYPISITVLALSSNPVATVERKVSVPQWYNPEPQVDQFPELQALVDEMYATQGDEQLAVIEELNTKLTEMAWFNVWYQANNTYFSTADITVTPILGAMFPTLRHITKS